MIDLLIPLAITLSGALGAASLIGFHRASRRLDRAFDTLTDLARAEARAECERQCLAMDLVLHRRLRKAIKDEAGDVRETCRRELANHTRRLDTLSQGLDAMTHIVGQMLETAQLGLFTPDDDDDAEAN